MALATEEEWEKDPELRQMRKDFVASFAGRKQVLEALLSQIEHADAAALKQAAATAHKLAGAAESYGFPTLTKAAGALDDWFDSGERVGGPARAVLWVRLLIEMLGEAQRVGKDPSHYADDPRWKS